MNSIRSNQGFAYLLVLLILIILSATVITVSASLRGQSNVMSMSGGSTLAMAAAENGLAIGVARLRANGLNTFTAITTWNCSSNGYSIRVQYNPTTGLLTSEASDTGNLANSNIVRRVAVNVAVGQGVNLSLNHSFFAGSTIKIEGNGSSNLSMNVNNDNDFYAGTSISMKNSNINVAYNGGDLYSPGSITTNKGTGSINLGNGSNSYANSRAITFPEIDFTQIEGTTTCTRKSDFFTKFYQLSKNGGGILEVDVTNADLVNGNYSIDFANTDNPNEGKYTSLLSNSNVIVVFKKDPTVTSDYTVTFAGPSSCSQIQGPITILAEGSLHFNKVNLNMSGIVYSTGTIHTQNLANINIPAFVAKGDIHIDNCTNNFNFGYSRANALNMLRTSTQKRAVTSNWREL